MSNDDMFAYLQSASECTESQVTGEHQDAALDFQPHCTCGESTQVRGLHVQAVMVTDHGMDTSAWLQSSSHCVAIVRIHSFRGQMFPEVDPTCMSTGDVRKGHPIEDGVFDSSTPLLIYITYKHASQAFRAVLLISRQRHHWEYDTSQRPCFASDNLNSCVKRP